jgi:hypothetical protein
MVDGLRMELPDELGTPWAKDEAERPHRSLLGALGNSIIPQVAYQIIKAMIGAEEAI